MCKVADSEPHEGNQTCSFGETEIRKSRRIIFDNNFLEIMDYQDFEARFIIKCSSIESSFTEVGLSFEVLTDELKPVVAENIQTE